MAVGLALASNTQTSTLSSIATAALLTSPNLPQLLARNSELLEKNYIHLTKFLKNQKVPYIPAYAGLYIMVHVAPHAQSWDEESEVISRFKATGVLISAGRSYHGPPGEMGWARVGFAIPELQLLEALRRMESVFQDQRFIA